MGLVGHCCAAAGRAALIPMDIAAHASRVVVSRIFMQSFPVTIEFVKRRYDIEETCQIKVCVKKYNKIN
jgi:hypothetical protein